MIHFLYQVRYILLLFIFLAGVFLWPGVRQALEVDNSLQIWFLEDDPALATYQDFQQKFGNDEVIILVVKDEKTLLNPVYFSKFMAMTSALEKIPDIESIIGPGNITLPGREAFGMVSAPLLSEDTDSITVKNRLSAMPLLGKQLFSHAYRSARFLIILKQTPDFDKRRGAIISQVRQTVYTFFPPGQAFFGGLGIIYAGLNTLSQHDFGLFMSIGALAMCVLVLYLYRRALVLLYMLGIVAAALYVTLGIYGTAGFRLNLMTVLLPVIVLLLGIMDAIHVINELILLRSRGLAPRESALEAIQRVFKPCLFTTLTTAAGFLSLLTSPMFILRLFGIFAALGICLSLFFTCLLGVIILPHTSPHHQSAEITSRRLSRLLGLVINRKRTFVVVSGLIILFFAAGMGLLQNDTFTLGYFPANHEVVENHRSMEQWWGPYMPLELLVEPKGNRPIYDAQLAQAAVAFTDSIQQLPGVGEVFGFHSLYLAGLQARYKQNSKRMLASQGALKLVHKQLDVTYPQLARKFIHTPSQTGRITLSGTMLSARELNAKMDTVLQISAATLGKVAAVKPAGYLPMYASIVGYVTQSQTYSLLMSVALIFVLVWAFIRHLKLSLLTVIPNLFPVLIMLGTMGWLGIHLDTATASIAAIVLSFSIDDSIHFIYNYLRYRKAGKTPAEARIHTMLHIGPAILLTGIILFSGYILMLLGSLKTVQWWGLLTACAILGALYGELIVFPLVLEKFDRKKAVEPE